MMRETPCAGRKVAVLGDMLELGEWTERAHRDIGARAANCGLAFLMTVGASARLIAQGAVEAGMETHRVLSLATADGSQGDLADAGARGGFYFDQGFQAIAVGTNIGGIQA